jgi:hypothetical protein
MTASRSSQGTSSLLSGCRSETFAASAAAISREAADSGRLTDGWKVVFGYSARIRVKFRASQLYQARGYSSYELPLEPEVSEILFNNNKMVGIGQRLIAAEDGLRCAQAGLISGLIRPLSSN